MEFSFSLVYDSNFMAVKEKGDRKFVPPHCMILGILSSCLLNYVYCSS
jgi:hypothetical protein